MRSAAPGVLKWAAASLLLVAVASAGAFVAWRANRVGGEPPRESSNPAAPRPASLGVSNLKAVPHDGLLTLTWDPPKGVKSLQVLVSSDAYLGGGKKYLGKQSYSIHPAVQWEKLLPGDATSVVVTAPPGAMYEAVVMSTVGTRWASSAMLPNVTIQATASVDLTVPRTGHVGQGLAIGGAVVVPPGTLPARGEVRLLADRRDPRTRRWVLIKESRTSLDVGRAIGAKSTFRYRFTPGSRGWWRFRAIRWGGEWGITWAKRQYVTRAVKVT